MKKIALIIGILCYVVLGFEKILGINAYSLLTEKRWEIESMKLGDYEIIVPNQVENAYLSFQNGSIAGIPGCNNYFSKYEVRSNGKHIIIQSGVLTKKMCNTLDMQIESIFAKNFVGGFVVQGDDEGIDLVGETFRVRLVPSLLFEP